MKKISCLIVLFIILLSVSGCFIGSGEDENPLSEVRIENNTAGIITVYYAQEEKYNDEYDIKTYNKNISAGSYTYIKISPDSAFKVITAVSGGVATTYSITGDVLVIN